MTTPAAEQPFSETPCTGQHAATMWTWARALTNGGADVEAPKESTCTPLDNAIRLVVQAGRAPRAARCQTRQALSMRPPSACSIASKNFR